MSAKQETFERWLRKRVSQTNSRCKRAGVRGRLDAGMIIAGSLWPPVCIWCREDITDPRRLSLDHLKPLSAGGANVNDNIAVVHRACNLLRSDWSAESWGKFVKVLQEAKLWSDFKRRYKPRRFKR